MSDKTRLIAHLGHMKQAGVITDFYVEDRTSRVDLANGKTVEMTPDEVRAFWLGSTAQFVADRERVLRALDRPEPAEAVRRAFDSRRRE